MSDASRDRAGTRVNRQAVWVGLFVIFALVVLAGGVLTIGDLNKTFTRQIDASVVFNDVGGLKVGDNVWFSGLKVGTVRRLDFQEDGSGIQVALAVDREAAAHIPADVLAKVGSDGLIGNKIVVLYEGTTGGPLLADGGKLAVGTSVSTDEMKDMLQQNNQNLLAITADLRALTSRLASGEGSAAKLLADDEMYIKLGATVSSLEKASSQADELTDSLAVFAAKLNTEGSLPNDLASDKEMFASLKSSVHDLKVVTEHTSSLVTKLEAGAANPNTPIGTLLQDESAGGDLKSTLSNLDESSKLLSEDLAAMQHNLLLRGYFKKKEREEAKEAKKAEDAP